jgi:hypothetical protein
MPSWRSLTNRSADIRDIVRLYIDKEFRREVVSRITDEEVRAFWTKEFPNMNYMNAIDGVAPDRQQAWCVPGEPCGAPRCLRTGRNRSASGGSWMRAVS